MDANEKDQKIKDLTGKIEFLSSIIIKAHKYAKDDPEVALTQARKSAEAICRNIFSAEIGDPGKIMLDELIKKLNERKIIPTKILLPLGTIQAYGNYGTHAQSANETIDFNYITPCLSALAQVSSWYFTEYLKTALPPGLADEKVSEPLLPSPPAGSEAAGRPVPIAPEVGPVDTAPAEPPTPSEKPGSRTLVIGLSAVVLLIIAVVIYFRIRTSEAQPLETPPSADSVHAAATPAAPPSQAAVTQPTTAGREAGAPLKKEETVKKEEAAPAGPAPAVRKASAPSKAASGTPAPSTPASGGAAPSAPPAIVEPSGPTTDPALVKEVAPVYPRSLRSSGITGEVRLRILVDSTGVPADIRILSYDNEKFKQPALDAARQYRFKPALSSGKRVSGWTIVKMTVKEE